MRKIFPLTLLTICLVFTMVFGKVDIFAEEPFIKLECEEADEVTEEENIFGNDSNRYIKIEDVNVGGTFPGAWIMFDSVNFSGNGANKVSVNYAKKPESCAEDTKLEFRLGDVGGELIGEVALTKADGWGNYNIATADLKKTITGKHDLYVVMRGTHNSTYTYIGQLDYIEFTESSKPANPGKTNAKTSIPAATLAATPTATPTATLTASQTATSTISKTPVTTQGDILESTKTPSDTNSEETSGDSEKQFPWIIVIIAGVAVIGTVASIIIIKKKKA